MSGTTIWYLAQGYQSVADSAHAGQYTGSETDSAPVPAFSPNEASDSGSGPGVDQAVAARGRDPPRVLPAVRRRVLQLPPRRRERPRRLAVRRLLAGRHAESRLPGAAPHGGRGERELDQLRRHRSPTACRARGAAFNEVGAPLKLTSLKTSSLASYGATITWQSSSPSTTRVSYGVSDFGVPTAWAPVGVTGGGTPTATLIGLDAVDHVPRLGARRLR